MKKINTVRANEKMIFKGHKLTIGLDLGDRWSSYCVLDEAGKVILEQELPTTPVCPPDQRSDPGHHWNGYSRARNRSV